MHHRPSEFEAASQFHQSIRLALGPRVVLQQLLVLVLIVGDRIEVDIEAGKGIIGILDVGPDPVVEESSIRATAARKGSPDPGSCWFLAVNPLGSYLDKAGSLLGILGAATRHCRCSGWECVREARILE